MIPDKKRVCVLGSNSFSGSDFIDLLLSLDNYEVVGVSRSSQKGPVFIPESMLSSSNYTFYQMDLNDHADKLVSMIDEFRPDYIVNFAAQSEVAPSWENPTDWYQTNVVALTNIINQLHGKDYIKRYVHISSPEVYGSCEGTVREEAPLNPSTPYAASKAGADLSLMTFQKHFNFPLVTVRATNVYGARQQLFKIIPRSVIKIRSSEIIELHGGGSAIKSYIHIRDVSRGELAIMENGNIGEIYHLSPDRGYAVRDIVKGVCKIMGVDFETCTEDVGERPGQDAAYIIDSTKTREQFGWKPEMTLDEGLKGVVEWVEAYWQEIEEQSLIYIHKK